MRKPSMFRSSVSLVLSCLIATEAAAAPVLARPVPAVPELIGAAGGLDAAAVDGVRAHYRTNLPGIAPAARAMGASAFEGVIAVPGAVSSALVAFVLRTVVWPRLEKDLDHVREVLSNAIEEEGVAAVRARLGRVAHPDVERLVRDLAGPTSSRAAGRIVGRFIDRSLATIKRGLLARTDELAASGLAATWRLGADLKAGGESALIALVTIPIRSAAGTRTGTRSVLTWLFEGNNLKKALVALASVAGIALAIFLGVATGGIAPFVALLGALGGILGLLNPNPAGKIDIEIPGLRG